MNYTGVSIECVIKFPSNNHLLLLFIEGRKRMKIKKRIIGLVALTIVFSGIQNVNYSNCEAEDNIDIYEAQEVVGDLNEIVSENQEELIQEYIEDCDLNDSEIEDLSEELEDGNVEDVLEQIEKDCTDEEVLDELNISNIEDLEKQAFVNPETNQEFKTVEEVKEYMELNGAEISDEEYNVYEAVEEIKSDNDLELAEMIVEVDQTISDVDGDKSWFFGEKVEASSYYEETKKQWNSLTKEEKALIILEPKKAIATKSLTNKAFEMTQKEFKHNGLGDKSDGFRHGVWNALLTRDITRAWAKAYTTAHESGKSKKQLEKKLRDGFKEKTHRAMDLHNNAEGRDVIHWYDTILNVSDKKLKNRIKKKLTNKKSDIYWLHK